ncbi:MAG: phage tail family protein [Oscillospiraceae bacterium]|nr:phage tail family protein [Oscillospiraceae bacterium]
MALTFAYSNGMGTLSFRPDSPFWVSDIDGMSSNSVTVSASQSTGQAGSTISALSVQPRSITVVGQLMGDIKSSRKRLLDVVLPGVSGVFTITDGAESWYIRGTPSKTPDISNGGAIQDFQFTLYCPYPYWQQPGEIRENIAAITPKFRLPFNTGGGWKVSEYTESVFKNVRNTGNVETGFTVSFRAVTDVQNPELYHVGKREIIKLQYTLLAGEIITVNTRQGHKSASLIQNGSESNAFRLISVDSNMGMTLSPGDNILRYGADDNPSGLRVFITLPKGVRSGV